MRCGDETWEEPILAQMAGLELDDETTGPEAKADVFHAIYDQIVVTVGRSCRSS
ncbi:MAG TPA: hypothetical protein VM427_06825 [Patescibacteria group bacterium]|nr:hypothetical protein [Patescibacteria group bacterium]